MSNNATMAAYTGSSRYNNNNNYNNNGSYHNGSPPNPIVGSVIGVGAFLILCGLAYYYFFVFRKRQQQRIDNPPVIYTNGQQPSGDTGVNNGFITAPSNGAMLFDPMSAANYRPSAWNNNNNNPVNQASHGQPQYPPNTYPMNTQYPPQPVNPQVPYQPAESTYNAPPADIAHQMPAPSSKNCMGASASIDSAILLDQLGNGMQYEKSLGKSRFLRTIKCRHPTEGAVVVKFFVKPPALDAAVISQHISSLQSIRDELADSSNCCAYAQVVDMERAVCLVRQYHQHSLYDRISTRPFLNDLEKKWIVYQLLHAVDNIHSRRIHHGDIKTENILLTSWNWVQLTDVAQFKPTLLPEDDPADFAYYFDSSLRRSCYVAPERFYTQHDLRSKTFDRLASLTASMDIFSVGCVMAELFMEGKSLFTLSQMLQYRQGLYDPSTELQSIQSVEIRNMIMHMIQLDPSKRSSAAGYISNWKNTFPAYYETFLYQYMVSIAETYAEPAESTTQLTTSDLKLLRMYHEFDKIAYSLGFTDDSSTASATASGFFPLALNIPNYNHDYSRLNPENNGTLILTVVCSCIRNLSRPSLVLSAIDLCLALSTFISDQDKFDRVLPYFTYFLSDVSSVVRVRAVQAISQLLSMVTTVSATDANIFVEYALPCLEPLVRDTFISVRATYARCLPVLAETAMRYLELSQATTESHTDEQKTSTQPINTYDSKLSELHSSFLDGLIVMLSDSESIVKRCAMEDISNVCLFLGREKTHDVVFAHMVTYLNEGDWLLKQSFFDHIVEVGTFAGGKNLQQYLLPLMLQSLKESQPVVVERVIGALRQFANLGFLNKMKLREICIALAPFLIDPVVWLRTSAISFVSTAARQLSIVDQITFIAPVLRPYLTSQVSAIDEEKLLEFLRPPLNAELYIRASILISRVNSGGKQTAKPPRNEMASLRRKSVAPSFDASSLKSILTEEKFSPPDQESVFLCLPYILNRDTDAFFFQTWLPNANNGSVPDTTLDTRQNIKTEFLRPAISFTRKTHSRLNSMSRSQAASKGSLVYHGTGLSTASLEVPSSTVNAARPVSPARALVSRNSIRRAEASVGTTVMDAAGMLEVGGPQAIDQLEAMTDAGDREYAVNVPVFTLTSFMETDKRNKSATDVSSFDLYRDPLPALLEKNAAKAFPPPISDFGPKVSSAPTQFKHRRATSKNRAASSLTNWKPQGLLIANFTEHTASVISVVVAPDEQFFVTSSLDKTVKVWDCRRLEKNVTNRSRLTYYHDDEVTATVFCGSSHTIATAAKNGRIDIVRIDVESGVNDGPPRYVRMSLARRLNLTDEYAIVLDFYANDLQSILVCLTSAGIIYAWDFRTNVLLWRLEVPPHLGCAMTLVLDTTKFSWLAVGTMRGVICTWDLRFQIIVKSWMHPAQAPINCLGVCTGVNSTTVQLMISCGVNEISAWDLDTAECRVVYNACEMTEKLGRYVRSLRYLNPPSSQISTFEWSSKAKSRDSGHAITSFCRPSLNHTITAGTDSCIRNWDTSDIEKSRTLLCPKPDNMSRTYSSYRTDALTFYHERAVPAEHAPSKSTLSPRTQKFVANSDTTSMIYLDHQVTYSHVDAINDMKVCEVPFPVLITVGRDGIVKVWK